MIPWKCCEQLCNQLLQRIEVHPLKYFVSLFYTQHFSKFGSAKFESVFFLKYLFYFLRKKISYTVHFSTLLAAIYRSPRVQSPEVRNPRAADRYPSVAQSVPGRTRINQLCLFYLLSKSETMIQGDSLLHLKLVGKEENIKYNCKLQKIIHCAR